MSAHTFFGQCVLVRTPIFLPIDIGHCAGKDVLFENKIRTMVQKQLVHFITEAGNYFLGGTTAQPRFLFSDRKHSLELGENALGLGSEQISSIVIPWMFSLLGFLLDVGLELVVSRVAMHMLPNEYPCPYGMLVDCPFWFLKACCPTTSGEFFSSGKLHWVASSLSTLRIPFNGLLTSMGLGQWHPALIELVDRGNLASSACES